MEFKEQYRHPLWQKRRLEALQEAGFVCQRCGDSDTTLHVHHKRYVKGRMVWEYSVSDFDVLCEPCHEQAHAEKDALNAFISKMPSEAIPEILSLLVGYCEERNGVANAVADEQQFEFSTVDPMDDGFEAATRANARDRKSRV